MSMGHLKLKGVIPKIALALQTTRNPMVKMIMDMADIPTIPYTNKLRRTHPYDHIKTFVFEYLSDLNQ